LQDCTVLTRCCVISPKSTQTDRFSLQYLFWLFMTNQKSPLLTGDPELTMNRWPLSTKSLSLSLSPPLTIIFFLLDLIPCRLIVQGNSCRLLSASATLTSHLSALLPPIPSSFMTSSSFYSSWLVWSSCDLVWSWRKVLAINNSWWPSVAVHTFLRLQTIYHQASHGCLVLTSIVFALTKLATV
jgi:hypothetical protein